MERGRRFVGGCEGDGESVEGDGESEEVYVDEFDGARCCAETCAFGAWDGVEDGVAAGGCVEFK